MDAFSKFYHHAISNKFIECTYIIKDYLHHLCKIFVEKFKKKPVVGTNGLVKEMKTEFVHWGIPKGKKDEEILYTKSRTLEGAEKIKEVLTSEFDCREVRIQIIEFSATGEKELSDFFNNAYKD